MIKITCIGIFPTNYFADCVYIYIDINLYIKNEIPGQLPRKLRY
jgi:hypothetical protein